MTKMQPATKPAAIKGANGVLPLPRRWLGLFPASTLYGGPFRHAPAAMAGLCLLEAPPPLAQHRHMPIEDFQVPHDSSAVEGALKEVFAELLRGRPVYVGCAGGWGRTGLMLSLAAKVAGEAEPIRYVRKHYTPRAVETPEQERYVEQFDAAPLRRWLRFAVLRHLLHRIPRT